jgi:hypothetical protein
MPGSGLRCLILPGPRCLLFLAPPRFPEVRLHSATPDAITIPLTS